MKISGKDNYISVILNNNSKKEAIEKGNESKTKDIREYYNGLISLELKEINQENPNLPQYDCEVKISETTGRVYQVNFSKK